MSDTLQLCPFKNTVSIYFYKICRTISHVGVAHVQSVSATDIEDVISMKYLRLLIVISTIQYEANIILFEAGMSRA